jgi:SAM-dependent methyltransferase
MKDREWFAGWFDSKYYHILYKDRDYLEAQHFLDNLVSRLQLAPGLRVLDMACGKGRHSVYLAQKGFRVTGVDLSEKSIAYAKQFENDRLSFYVQDMRKPFHINYFDVVLNLFTSFGYFEKEGDNLKAIRSMAKAVKPGGSVVIDFMNSAYVIKNLVKQEEKTVEGITFAIRRWVDSGFIVKEIAFDADGHEYIFHERVRALTLADFAEYFNSAGLKIIHLYGDYQLNSFDEQRSGRLIMAAEKDLSTGSGT